MKKIIICLCLLLGISLMPAQAADTAEIGMHHTVTNGYYINKSGEMYTWTNAIIPLPGRVVDISAGSQHITVGAVLEDGSLYTWGRNEYGQLGTGDKTDRETPTKVTGISNVISIAMGRGFTSAAVTSDGSVYVWGNLYKGDDKQYNPVFEDVLSPRRIKEISNAVSVSVGDNGFLVLCSDGSVYSWGSDDGGSNGYGERRSSAKPIKLNLPPVRAVSRGRYAAAAVTMDGKLYTWGQNDNHILGRPCDKIDCTPGLVDIEPIKSVCLGQWYYAAAITQKGTVYQWGSTRRDDHEAPPETDSETPKILSGDTDIQFLQLSLGDGSAGAISVIRTDGDLNTWGWNENGQLGINAITTPYYHYPASVSSDAMIPNALPAGTLDNLSAKQRTYTAFTDVDENAWYGTNKTRTIAEAYELSLVDGTGKNKFAPEQPLKISEAIRLVCTLQGRYSGGDGIYTGSSPWYQPYVHHAITTGICQVGDFSDYTANATRAQMAYLFAHALPEKELSIISEYITIPDVTDTTPYAKEIRQLYQSGILAGIDNTGTFAPSRTITRAEATAIFLRLVSRERRLHPDDPDSNLPSQSTPPAQTPDTPENSSPSSPWNAVAGTWEDKEILTGKPGESLWGGKHEVVRKVDDKIAASSSLLADRVFLKGGASGIFARKGNEFFYLDPATLKETKIMDVKPYYVDPLTPEATFYHINVWGGNHGTVLLAISPDGADIANIYTWKLESGLQETGYTCNAKEDQDGAISCMGDDVLYINSALGIWTLDADGKINMLTDKQYFDMKYFDHALYCIGGEFGEHGYLEGVGTFGGEFWSGGGTEVVKLENGKFRTIFSPQSNLEMYSDEIIAADGDTVTIRYKLQNGDHAHTWGEWQLDVTGSGTQAKVTAVTGSLCTPDNIGYNNTNEEILNWWNEKLLRNH